LRAIQVQTNKAADAHVPKSGPAEDQDSISTAAESGKEPSLLKEVTNEANEQQVDRKVSPVEATNAGAGAIENADTAKPAPSPSLDKHMKALIEADESSSEPEESTQNDYSWRMEWASQLSSEALYSSYLQKLDKEEKNKKKAAPKGPKKDQKKTKKDPKLVRSSKLVKSVVDYVRVLEQRIQTLEDHVKSKEDEDDEDESKMQENSGEVDLAVNFFHAEKEFDGTGSYIGANNTTPGTYTSRTDRQNLIRVLFDWSHDLPENHTRRLGSGAPNPKHVKIIALGITSEPIKAFLDNAIGTTRTSPFPLIRFTAPFRPLLSNAAALKRQLSRLEEKFGCVFHLP
jgi:hypothetical protein